MKSVQLTALLASAALLAAPAFAQSTDTTPPPPVTAPAAPADTTMPPAATTPAPGASTSSTTTTTTTTTVAAPEGFSPVSDMAALTADKVIGIAVHGPDNSDIGKVTDIDLGSDGKPTGLIADIGGFLGIGSHTVRLGFDDVAIMQNADAKMIAVSSLSEEALKALPAYQKP